jgi:hypothetical protein
MEILRLFFRVKAIRDWYCWGTTVSNSKN